MKSRLTHQLPPSENNPRNSEGAFLRGKNGEILFAYSRYKGESFLDHAACDIALITSDDEGEHWSEPRIIAPAAFFGTKNVMSVSALAQQNGDLAFYFIIKENSFSTTLGRAVSSDGEHFMLERCRLDCKPAYYVINNDRFVRLKSGRVLVPTSYITTEKYRALLEKGESVTFATTLLYSDDDGVSFRCVGWEYTSHDPVNAHYGLQEPGIIERGDGSLYCWMRTNYGCQYECESDGDIEKFTVPHASEFTSPASPMQVKAYDGEVYAIYNPIPNYNGRFTPKGTLGRTPFVLRKSCDGVRFGAINVIEDDPSRGYCYPATFKTADNSLLVAYCRGDAGDGNTLCRLGITKIEIDSIE